MLSPARVAAGIFTLILVQAYVATRQSGEGREHWGSVNCHRHLGNRADTVAVTFRSPQAAIPVPTQWPK